MKKSYGMQLVCAVFLILIFVIGIGSVRLNSTELKVLIGNYISGTETFQLSSLENLLQNNLFAKEYLTELNGFADKIMSRRLVGNGEFYKDSNGVMHMKQEYISDDKLVADTQALSKTLKQRSIPFLVSQIPERADYGDSFSRYIDSASTSYINDLKDASIQEGALYLNEGKELTQAGFSIEDIFFKTDIHYTTQAEFEIVRSVVRMLETEGGLVFSNKATALDVNQYRIETTSFWGNLINSSGKHYVETDKFLYYIPLFDTSMCLENPTGNLVRTGSFEKVCMNGLRDYYTPNENVYRIIDYMQWPSPFYRITNDLIAENDILVLGDSLSMRKMAYLSLLCRSVTVLDTRYFGTTDYLEEALDTNYDAVVLFPSSTLLNNGLGEMISSSAKLQTYHVIENNDGTFDLYVEVKNKGVLPWTRDDRITLQFIINGTQTGIQAELENGITVIPGQSYSFAFHSLDKLLCHSSISLQLQKNETPYYGGTMQVTNLPELPENQADAEIVSVSPLVQKEPGGDYSCSVTVKNTGTSSWSSLPSVRLCILENGTDVGLRVNFLDGERVFPGETYTFVVDGLRANGAEKNLLEFQMVWEGISYFGTPKSVLLTP